MLGLCNETCTTATSLYYSVSRSLNVRKRQRRRFEDSIQTALTESQRNARREQLAQRAGLWITRFVDLQSDVARRLRGRGGRRPLRELSVAVRRRAAERLG